MKLILAFKMKAMKGLFESFFSVFHCLLKEVYHFIYYIQIVDWKYFFFILYDRPENCHIKLVLKYIMFC